MREIKFRAWDRCGGEMWSHDELIKNNDMNFGGAIFEEDSNCLNPMQYTGLKDKNSKEIYKSDLLKDDYGLIFEVVEDNRESCTGFRIKLVKNDTGLKKHLSVGSCYDFSSWYCPDNFLEKIGNIYENQELLKEQK